MKTNYDIEMSALISEVELYGIGGPGQGALEAADNQVKEVQEDNRDKAADQEADRTV